MSSLFRFEMLAKAGYSARGVVFLLIAGLAVFSGAVGGKPESKSALSTLIAQPFGRVWVGLIGLGLLGFVAWRLAQSLADSDGHGQSKKGLAIRVALFGSAIVYIGLAGYALTLAILTVNSGGGSGERGLAGWLMSQPFGRYLVLAVGLGLIVGGILTAFKGATKKFERYLSIPSGNNVMIWICMYGLVARGFVFAITGMLFAYAGVIADPEQAGSMADALEWVRELPFGSLLYIVVAAGLAAFGLYNLVEARYRIVRGPTLKSLAQKGSRPLSSVL